MKFPLVSRRRLDDALRQGQQALTDADWFRDAQQERLRKEIRDLRAHLAAMHESLIRPEHAMFIPEGSPERAATIYPIPSGDFKIEGRGTTLRLEGVKPSHIYIGEVK
jgi:hypothetical protein